MISFLQTWRVQGGARWLPALACLALLQACLAPLPPDRQHSERLSALESANTTFGRALDAPLRAHPGRSAVYPVSDAMDAFVARMLMAQQAERTLDVQYYIWRNDTTGILLLNALKDAADRGVRVRLLLDDNGISGLDPILSALHAHPRIEVRLFNPFLWRTFKRLGYVFDFSRLNRRMHNKSMTVDGQLTVVGGRNIGDEYFDATDGVVFADLDMLAAGPIVNHVSEDFDRYWNSESSYPLDSLGVPAVKEGRDPLTEALAALRSSASVSDYLTAVRQGKLVQGILNRDLAFEWAPVRMVSDDPAKALGELEPERLIPARMFNEIGMPARSLDLVSPYFVPTATGTTAFTDLAEQGVRVRILTNSMEATDVLAVHAGYAKRRKDLLAGGVALYEMRKRFSTPTQHVGGFGSSGSSLHAKTFVVDGRRVFVGSFNFDPRSARLNTELGFVIDSQALAADMARLFDEAMPAFAYRLTLSDRNRLEWRVDQDGQEAVLTREPGATWLKQAWVTFLSVLPIESLL